MPSTLRKSEIEPEDGTPDDESPEWTEELFATAIRGDPFDDRGGVKPAVWIDRDILAAFHRQHPDDWHAEMMSVLRKAAGLG